MTDTAVLGAAAFLGKLIKDKKEEKFLPLFMEIQCPKCGFKTNDTRSFIIKGWIELLPKKKILCPICNTPMKFVRASLKMNGGGRANASDDAPVSSPVGDSKWHI